MAAKYKVTGCAKFFFFFIIAAPLAYIGASYYNGQDPFKQAGDLFKSGPGEKTETENNTSIESNNSQSGKVYDKNDLKEIQIKKIQTELDNCREEKLGQEALIEALNKEVDRLKKIAGE